MTDRVRVTAEAVSDARVDAELAAAARLRSEACSKSPETARRRDAGRWLLLLAAVAVVLVACAVALLVIAASRRHRQRTPQPKGAQNILVLERTSAGYQRREA